jgi:aspartate-semialdehyde dehydrogenase
MKKINVAIVGATGMVGQSFLRVLEKYNLPVENYHLLASKKSAGSSVSFLGKEYIVEELTENSFNRPIDIALFSAGGEVSKAYAPIAASHGVVVIDNSSQWRMDPEVPLVVPEVNPEDICSHKGIIANPNCSTIQAVVALKPLQDHFGIHRIVYSTYQAVSGAGQAGWNDLEQGIQGLPPKKFPAPIFSNCIPQIDTFLENGYTKEEMKMINETKKILHNPEVRITATTVRVPVFNGHSESINVELKKNFSMDQIFDAFRNQPGLVVQDNPAELVFPMPCNVSGTDEVYVGRIRRDESIENGINFWCVADNIRKGAAANTVQIAEKLIEYWNAQ